MLYPLITEIAAIFKQTGKPFWLAGGYSIDLFLGGVKTREHEDLDFVVKREDQLAFQNILTGWDLQAANPPGSGSLLPWPKNHFYDLPVHNIWCRENEDAPWNLEILFSEFENNEWVYRRNRSIRGPIEEFGWTTEYGLQVLKPEIQLLYKSRSRRPKDNLDLENCLPQLTSKQKNTLREWIITDTGKDHPWVDLI